MLDEQTKLLTLAHLKNGKSPSDAAEITGVSYATALKLRRELHAAEERNTVLQLFKLDEAALNILLESVQKQLKPAIEAFGVGEIVESEVEHISKGVNGAKLLSEEFQDAARAISLKITTAATTSNNAETILSLSKALCELQRAFFSSDAGGTAGNIPLSSFEQHLKN